MYRQPITLLSLVVLWTLSSVRGLAHESQQFNGVWTLDPEQSDDIRAAINRSIAHMDIIVRQIARSRLRSTNVSYPQLAFSIDEDVRVDMLGYPSVSSPANGEPVLWHRGTGRACTQMRGSCVVVTTTWHERALVQTFLSEDGQRQNVFTVSTDGTKLTMVATMTSPRLRAPLVYRLVYSARSSTDAVGPTR